jgi:hypothetical protein
MPDGISTIRDFYKVAQDRDFVRKNQLRVLSINSGAGLSVNFSADDLIYAKVASLPERQVQTSPATFMGIDFNVPGGVKYVGSDNYTIEFFADQQFNLWDKFNEWTFQLFDDETSSGNFFAPKSSAQIVLVAVDNELNLVKQFTLVGVICKSISPLQYDISDTGAIQNFTANFSYHFCNYSNP